MEFKIIKSDHPMPDAEREALLENPAFGVNFTDHQVIIEWTREEGWQNARVEPYGPIMMDPSSAVLHYGQEIFEGIKAYRHQDGSIHTFRPHRNGERLQKSAHRMALPELPVDVFVESLRALISVDGAWVPAPVNEKTLYFRPFEIAAENFLGVRAAHRAEYRVISKSRTIRNW
jgi:branched-chain amino acid aminotransferase